MTRTGLFRYVPWSRVQPFMERGWLAVSDLQGAHGQWSVLMWHCECGAYEP